MSLSRLKKEYPTDYWLPSSLKRALLVFTILSLAVAIAIPPGFELINPYGWPQVWEFLQAAIHPDLGTEFLKVTWDAAWVTFSYALIGTFLSLCWGFLGACITSETILGALFPRLAGWGFHRTVRFWLTIPRSLHEVIWGLLLINGVGLDPIAGILAIAIPYGAIVAKIFAEILDDTPREALESLLHAGSRPIAAIAFGLLPRAKLSLMSYGFYRFECSLRSAAILGVIGAGGLGYQMMLSLESLRYNQLWTLFYAIFFLNGTMDLLSTFCRHQIGVPKRFELKQALQSAPRSLANESRTILPWIAALGGGGALLGVAWVNLNPEPSKLWHSNAWGQLPLSSAPIDVAIFPRLPWLSLQTLSMSILAIAIASLGAFGLAWIAAMSWGKPESKLDLTRVQRIRIVVTHCCLLMMRAIPSPIWALVFLYLFRPGIMVGAIALGVHNIGVMGRLFAEDIENADGRGLRSLRNAGGLTLSTVGYGLLPSVITRFGNYAAYRWEVCLRESLILALVGAGGLGVLLKEEISNFNAPNVLILLILFWLCTLGVEWGIQKAKMS